MPQKVLVGPNHPYNNRPADSREAAKMLMLGKTALICWGPCDDQVSWIKVNG